MSHMINTMDVMSVRNANKITPFDSPKLSITDRIQKIYSSFSYSKDKTHFLNVI
jgi:hypothetical protein